MLTFKSRCDKIRKNQQNVKNFYFIEWSNINKNYTRCSLNLTLHKFIGFIHLKIKLQLHAKLPMFQDGFLNFIVCNPLSRRPSCVPSPL